MIRQHPAVRPGENQKKQLTFTAGSAMIELSLEHLFVIGRERRFGGKMNKEDKLKALDAALTQIEKAYGKGSVMKLGDSGANMNIETIPTGSTRPGYCTGTGRCSEGTNHRVYGPESSGKTTVALHMVAEVQKRGGIAGFYRCRARTRSGICEEDRC